MKPIDVVLGISTAGPVEVALVKKGKQISLASERPALESLLTLVRDLLAQAHATIEDVSLIGVCVGPGSFTGLRIGVAFARSLAQTRQIPVVGVSAYDVAAIQSRSHPQIAVARGKPGHYYARVTVASGAQPTYLSGPREIIEQAAERFSSAGSAAVIAGPDFSYSKPGTRALAVAELARSAIESGAETHWTKIAIDYGQRPNAVLNWEERRASREGGPR